MRVDIAVILVGNNSEPGWGHLDCEAVKGQQIGPRAGTTLGYQHGSGPGIPSSQGGAMKAFLATVLSVIAVGVLLIAYGLLAPRASAASQVVYDPQTGMYQLVQPESHRAYCSS